MLNFPLLDLSLLLIARIQKQLGHKSLQMTLHYIQAIDTDLADELSKLDNLI